jgi:hypothetical protein
LQSGQSIAPGQSATFTFNMTAPATVGSYSTNLQMIKEGVAWFGDKLAKNITVAVPSVSALSAQLVSNTIPDTMEIGKAYSVSVTYKNTGSDTWTAATGFKLGLQGTDNFKTGQRLFLQSGQSITPGQSATFVFNMNAPATVGSYSTNLQMIKEGVAWFGDKLAKNITVTVPLVSPLSAQLISSTIPDIMEIGKAYSVSVTYKNTGSDTWTAATGFKLGVLGTDNFKTGQRLFLQSGQSIAPGQSATFTFNMTAPATVGSYTTNLQMIKEGAAWFGDKLTKTISVNVQALSAQLTSNTIPTSMEAGKSYSVSVTYKNTGSDTWTAATGFKLGVLGTDNFKTGQRLFLQSGQSIAAGQSVTLTFTMTAPATTGSYTTNLQMIKEGVAWYGDKLTVTIVVK